MPDLFDPAAPSPPVTMSPEEINAVISAHTWKFAKTTPRAGADESRAVPCPALSHVAKKTRKKAPGEIIRRGEMNAALAIHAADL